MHGNKRRFSQLQSKQEGVDAEIILHAMDATARVTTFSQHRGLLLGSQTLFKSLQAPLLSPVLEGTIKKLFFGKKKKMELIYWWEYGAEKTRINQLNEKCLLIPWDFLNCLEEGKSRKQWYAAQNILGDVGAQGLVLMCPCHMFSTL